MFRRAFACMMFGISVWMAALCGADGVQDSFARKLPDRLPGFPLAGTQTESADLMWQVKAEAAGLTFAEGGGVTNSGALGGKAVATIPFQVTGDYRFTIGAEVLPGGCDWVALGAGGSGEYFWNRPADGGAAIAVTIRGSLNASLTGRCEVFLDGMRTVAGTVMPEEYGFDPARPVRITLEIDRHGSTFSLMLNEFKAVENAKLPESFFSAPIKSVGFMVNQPVDDKLRIRNFFAELKAGELIAVVEEKPTGPAVINIDASAVARTNMHLGGQNGNGTWESVLEVQQSFQLSEPYFADFDFPVTDDAGNYDVWALLLGCNESWVSDFVWSIDGAPAVAGHALEGSGNGVPRWIKLGKIDLAPGEHTIRFELSGRRRHPDDAWSFRLWRVVLSPENLKFTPTGSALLAYDPQAARGVHTGGGAAAGGRAIRQISLKGEYVEPLLLSVDPARQSGIPNAVWRDYAEGGVIPEEDFFLPRLVKPLRPRFIRKDHCLDNSVTKDENGKLFFDFSSGIMTIKAIRKVGAQPIVGLDVLPPALLQRIDGHDWLPKELWAENETFRRDWGATVENFVSALKKEQLEVKYFQCFNEPDFAGYADHPEAAVAVFEVAARALKRADPDALISGIGCGDGINRIWKAFLELIEKNPGLVDIFDFHQYQTSPQRLVEIVGNLRRELTERGAGNMKIALTEWGISSSGSPHYRADMRSVLYNAELIRALMEAGVDIGGLFCIRDLPTDNWQWGLITTDGLQKPAYWGQWLWAQLPDGAVRLALDGEDAMVRGVAFEKDGEIFLLCWNLAEECSVPRKVIVEIKKHWRECRITQYVLDMSRHISYIPEDATVEFPGTHSERQFSEGEFPFLELQMQPESMCLIRLSELQKH